MNDTNPYSPPKAPLEPRGGMRAWFSRRPIPVFAIAAFCIVQYVFIVGELARNWSGYVRLMDTGAVSPIVFFARLAYPTLLFLAGVALLARWNRAATVLFAAYAAVGAVRLAAGDLVGIVSLAIVVGCAIYSLRAAARRDPS
jgi:hypothetical protein